MALPGKAVNPVPPAFNRTELFLFDGRNVLQLTNFKRSDTFAQTYRAPGRVLFTASANPFGTNPDETCQVFSMSALGGGIHQLTRFHGGGGTGCFIDFSGDSCGILGAVLDPVTKAVGLWSNCGAPGQNPSGHQMFFMRPDGSGLRQVSQTRGRVVEPDGTLMVELPGPAGYSGWP